MGGAARDVIHRRSRSDTPFCLLNRPRIGWLSSPDAGRRTTACWVEYRARMPANPSAPARILGESLTWEAPALTYLAARTQLSPLKGPVFLSRPCDRPSGRKARVGRTMRRRAQRGKAGPGRARVRCRRHTDTSRSDGNSSCRTASRYNGGSAPRVSRWPLFLRESVNSPAPRGVRGVSPRIRPGVPDSCAGRVKAVRAPLNPRRR